MYEKIGDEFKGHGTVNHSADEYSRMGGWITTNSVYGNYFHVSEAHLHRYLAEADFRHNHREKLGYDDRLRTEALISGTRASGCSTPRLTEPKTLKTEVESLSALAERLLSLAGSLRHAEQTTYSEGTLPKMRAKRAWASSKNASLHSASIPQTGACGMLRMPNSICSERKALGCGELWDRT